MTDDKQTCPCGQPTAGAWLCAKCTKTLSYALVNVSAHFVDLGNVERKQTRYGTGGATKGSIGKAQPLPGDMRFMGTKPVEAPGAQLKYDVWATVVAWTRTVMEQQPQLTGPACRLCEHQTCTAIRHRRWPAANTVTGMVHYLARRFTWVTSQQWVTAMFDEFLDLERRLTHMVNRPPDRWYAGRCGYTESDLDAAVMGRDPVTCRTELYATAERGSIECPGCGTRHDVSERRGILLDEAKDYLVTATEAASALLAWTDYDGTEKKLVDRIAKWRDRDKLMVADVTSLHGRDRHLYRLGDVQDLLVGDAQHAQAKTLAAS